MPQPPEYKRQHDFAEELGSTHGVHLDDEFDNIKVTSDAVRANLAKIQRDDGALRNQVVTRDSLDPSIALGFDPPTDWQPNTSYTPTSAVFYGSAMWLSKEAHISGDVFDPDQWDQLTDFAALTVEAEAARDEAVAAAIAAQADREQTGLDRAQTAADRQQVGLDREQTALDRVATGENRAASETAAQTAATQAGIATTKAGEAAGAAAQAAADRVQTGLDRQATQQAAGEAATSAQQAADSVAAVGLPDPPVPETFLRAKADGSGYEALTAQQVAEAIDDLLPLAQLYLGKSTTDPATAITGSLLSGAMLAAGAIVEMGENANGTYVRWENGLQLCAFFSNTAESTPQAAGAMFVVDTVGTFSFPATFISRPYVTDASAFYGRDGSGAGPNRGWGGSINYSTPFGTSVVIYGHSSNSAMFPGYFAVGFWK